MTPNRSKVAISVFSAVMLGVYSIPHKDEFAVSILPPTRRDIYDHNSKTSYSNYHPTLPFTLDIIPSIHVANAASIRTTNDRVSTNGLLANIIDTISSLFVKKSEEVAPAPIVVQSTSSSKPTTNTPSTIVYNDRVINTGITLEEVDNRIARAIASIPQSTSPLTYSTGGTGEVARFSDHLNNQIDHIYDSVGNTIIDTNATLQEQIEEIRTSSSLASGSAYGDLLYWNGSEWGSIATSSLGISGSMDLNALSGGIAIGTSNNATSTGRVAMGYQNSAYGNNSVAVGQTTVASGRCSSVFGYGSSASGNFSTASGFYAYAIGSGSVAVGSSANASGDNSTAVGRFNSASGIQSLAIGYLNDASGYRSTASGYCNSSGSGYYTSAIGYRNTASDNCATAVGYINTSSGGRASSFGFCNTSSGLSASAIGNRNTASGVCASAFGSTNTAFGTNSSAFGKNNCACADNAITIGQYNYSGTTGVSSVNIGLLNNSTGASINLSTGVITGTPSATTTTMSKVSSQFGIGNTAVSGCASTVIGLCNTTSGSYSTLVGHNNTSYSSVYSLFNTVAVGKGNISNGNNAISVGVVNLVRAPQSSAFGYLNMIGCGNTSSSVALGFNNNISGINSSCSTAVGYQNTTSEYGSSALGVSNTVSSYKGGAFGSNNSVTSGIFAYALGSSNVASANYSYALGRSLTNATSSTVKLGICNGWLSILSTGQVCSNTQASLSAGGTWTNASSRDLKENFTTLDSNEVLKKIIALPVTKWNYKTEDSSITHIGPIAQDFYEAFGVGGSSTSISTIDPAGVALLGIQALNTKIDLVQNTASSTAQSAALSAISNMKEFVLDKVTATVAIFDMVSTKKLQTDELCVEDVCIKKDEFLALINKNNINTTSNSSNNNQNNDVTIIPGKIIYPGYSSLDPVEPSSTSTIITTPVDTSSQTNTSSTTEEIIDQSKKETVDSTENTEKNTIDSTESAKEDPIDTVTNPTVEENTIDTDSEATQPNP